MLPFLLCKFKLLLSNPHGASLLVAVFQQHFVHLVSLYCILVILTIFQSLSLLLKYHSDLWSVIIDVTIIIILGSHELLPYKTMNLINVFCLLLHVSLPLLGLPFPWDPMILKLGQSVTLQRHLSIQVKGRVCTSLTVNQKLEMIQISEKGVSKAKIGQQSGLLNQTAKLWMRFLKEMKSTASVNTQMIRKQNSLTADMENVLVFCIEDQTILNIPLLPLLSRISPVCLCATPSMAAYQAPPSLGFSRQEHWSGLPFPSPIHESEKWKWSRSIVSDSSWPHGP